MVKLMISAATVGLVVSFRLVSSAGSLAWPTTTEVDDGSISSTDDDCLEDGDAASGPVVRAEPGFFARPPQSDFNGIWAGIPQ